MPTQKLRHDYLSACMALLLAGPAYAVDVNSQDFIPAPAGTNAMLGYFTYTTRDSFVPTRGSTIRHDTSLDSFVGIFRYARYMDVGGFRVGPQVLLPYGRLSNGSLGGVSLDSASGSADPIFAAPVWLVTNPSTNLVVVPYLYVPVGSYDAGRTLNVGENRWKFDFQFGGTQVIAHDFTLHVSGDVMWYGKNDDAMGTGVGTLKQDNTYQFQSWLSYAPPSDKTWNFAVGYSKYWGGRQRIDGIENGQATKADQVRLEVSKFLTPSFQVQGLVQKDIDMQGGFKEDFRTTLRLLKLF
ncbi:transporter [Methylobacillus sp. Pita2]|uniref:transporter n=1 Tax=Methylobacillus sp. Pita2 TaxID=3383245 RepID=UPI0038B623C2